MFIHTPTYKLKQPGRYDCIVGLATNNKTSCENTLFIILDKEQKVGT